MFNVGPGEIIIVALVLLMAVGPEQLPGVIRRVGRAVSQVRSMTDGLRADFMAGMDEIERATDPESWASSAGPTGDGKPPKKHTAPAMDDVSDDSTDQPVDTVDDSDTLEAAVDEPADTVEDAADDTVDETADTEIAATTNGAQSSNGSTSAADAVDTVEAAADGEEQA